MPPKKPDIKPHPKSAKAAEQKFGKVARKAAEKGGKKPVIWQHAERTVKRLPGSVPLTPERDIFEPVAKTFEASVTRTIEASPSDVYRAFNDPRRRNWCHEQHYLVRSSVAPRSLTMSIAVPNSASGTIVNVAISRKGNTRCMVSVTHKGFADTERAERARGDWRAALERLAVMVNE
ncbi:MAG TPA: hypothetical protein VE869_11655 [Gemmatimonas sp.]|nr:hypothetical protein [Gemmatimonas sp.]